MFLLVLVRSWSGVRQDLLFDERDLLLLDLLLPDLLLPDLPLLLARGLDELPELDDEPLLFARDFVPDPLELDFFAVDDPLPDDVDRDEDVLGDELLDFRDDLSPDDFCDEPLPDEAEDDFADGDFCDEPSDDLAWGAVPFDPLDPFDIDPFDELDPN